MKSIHKIFLVVLLLSFFLVSVNALVIQEKTFRDSGYESLSVEEPNKSKCADISFLISDINAETFLVLSLHYEFSPVLTGKATIELSLNENPLEIIKADEAFCNANSCWKRVVVEKTAIEKDNKLKICLNSSNSIPIVRVFNDSIIGIYKMPYFKEKDFVQQASNVTPQAGETITIKIKFKNIGSEDAYVKARHAKPFVEERMRKEVKEIGDTYFNGIVKAGEEKSFEYKLLIRQPTRMTIPSSILTYTNIFGEETSIASNEIDLNAIEPTEKISALIKIKEIKGNTATAELILKNNSNLLSFDDIKTVLSLGEGLSADKLSFEVQQLKATESVSLPFTLMASRTGTFIASCSVSMAESTDKSYCENIIIEFKALALDPRIIFGGIIALIGGIIYFYFFFYKKA